MKLSETVLLNNALDCCFLNRTHTSEWQTTRVNFGRDTLVITGEDGCRKFQKAIDQLLEGGIGRKVSSDYLINDVYERVYKKLKASQRFDESDGRALREDIKSLPLKAVRVIRDVKGAAISNISGPLRLGEFTFYEWKRHLRAIKETVDQQDGFSNTILDSASHDLVVECVVEASDDQKAEELAEQKFNKLEALIKFMIGVRGTDYEFGIVNYAGLRRNFSYIIDDGGVRLNIRSEGAIRDLMLDSDYFVNPRKSFARLINIDEGGASNLERKILRSVEWISQALSEVSSASSFVKTSIALEVLFSSNEKGVVSPSLMAKFSEGCAYILGESAKECIAIEKDIKYLYGVRSAVVHSGKSEVDREDLDRFIAYVRKVIMRLLDQEQYAGMGSIEQLNMFLLERKYQGVPA
ncbi:hypothetical protein ACIPI6_12790 [Pseudomonas protegens]|uniref:hypothetical protein n=1 Tax=Pseudomonas protegens TaxID=380021 RepID=UPI0037F8BA9B